MLGISALIRSVSGEAHIRYEGLRKESPKIMSRFPALNVGQIGGISARSGSRYEGNGHLDRVLF